MISIWTDAAAFVVPACLAAATLVAAARVSLAAPIAVRPHADRFMGQDSVTAARKVRTTGTSYDPPSRGSTG
jgi:hypothetical protein